MHKTQLYLETNQYLLLKDWAVKQRKSIAQVVRELVDSALKRAGEGPLDSIYDVVGKADSGFSNVSQNADDYLYGDRGAVERLEREGLLRDAPLRRRKKRNRP